jgi:hypothetical protein
MEPLVENPTMAEIRSTIKPETSDEEMGFRSEYHDIQQLN